MTWAWTFPLENKTNFQIGIQKEMAARMPPAPPYEGRARRTKNPLTLSIFQLIVKSGKGN